MRPVVQDVVTRCQQLYMTTVGEPADIPYESVRGRGLVECTGDCEDGDRDPCGVR